MAVHGSTAPAQPQARPRRARLKPIVPGLAVALVGAAVATGLAGLLPGASPLLVGIALGLAARNFGLLPDRLMSGLAFAGRVPLRIGIVLLGLQLSIRDLATLGWAIPVLALAVVGIGLFSTVGIGRLLGIAPTRALLIACGFSICGAAAVAGVESVLDADEEDTVSAVALVVLFGTLMIPTIPFLAEALHLPVRTAALWAGASIHEVAQVVAAGGLIGGGALTLAVTVKLARVLMLAPVAAVLSLRQRRSGGLGGGARPPIVPLFVLGFIAVVAVRSLVPVPHEVLGLASAVQGFLLTTAMLALGAGVRLRELARRGGRAVVLAAASTLVVGAVGLGGALLLA
ncbi:putative sulfate exporter family transporter [Sinomonas sp. JGH33]|uniref:Sulfate exporter family transporter n=1 Tax=Sinomonas terricola TaxID=3110330 RepID=A0ABU5T4H7_9MICC|nr:putative sulfate exporter family transporter [Sinomonas sp. JGH33]MEA5454452.1 putative sulfate exporter family transporter [Sinomonas sp. JGH33]